MPELISIQTQYFDCIFWSKDITASQQRLNQTMRDRGKASPASIINFYPPVSAPDTDELIQQIECKESLFFENKQYDVEFVFNDRLKSGFINKPPRVLHRLKNIEDSFHYSGRSHSLRATVNTGNDIGWFRIEVEFYAGNRLINQAIAFEVLPTKIDMECDLNKMNAAIDAEYPLWRFALAEKTQLQLAAVKKPHPQFLLLWLAQFESLREELIKGLKHIVNAPHSRLISVESHVKAEKLKNKLTPRLELEVKTARLNGVSNKRFQVVKKQLSIDTPENRFIKSVLKISIRKLNLISKIANKNQQAPETQRLSDSFFHNLDGWKKSLSLFQNHRVFQEVGDFKGLSRESLVLQQKPGYAKVYRVWQELKLYLDLLGNDASLSLRNIAELYEVWCFLEVRNILLALGFKEVQSKKARLINNGLDVSMKDGLAGAFSFEREDGVSLILAHEPLFRRDTKPVKSWTIPQQPDILLKARFIDNTEFIWIFDAKYRIKSGGEIDLAPDDAINQLHRYRDALIHQHKISADISAKTRPVFGAYALYPGFYNQCIESNPYQMEIDEIGIGAFSLLPGDDLTGSHWLKLFLKQKLGVKNTTYSMAESEQFFVEESVRIPYTGTSVYHYSDLTIAVNGLVTGRSKEYVDNLEQGNLLYYHMKLFASVRQNIEQHIIKEARYLAVAVRVNSSLQEISYLYPIIGVEQIKRSMLTVEQTGTKKIKDPEEIYWLFKLGDSLKLKFPVKKAFSQRFVVKLTSARAFTETGNWADLPLKYKLLS